MLLNAIVMIVERSLFKTQKPEGAMIDEIIVEVRFWLVFNRTLSIYANLVNFTFV